MPTRDIQCRKCNTKETISIEVEEQTGLGKFARRNTFKCNACDQLSTLDTVNEKFMCKHCRGTDLTKLFPVSKVKCSKCGEKAFDALIL